MIVFLLLMIIAILLFGATAVARAAGFFLALVTIVIGGLLFLSAGVTGLMWLGILTAIFALVFLAVETNRRLETKQRWAQAIRYSREMKEREGQRDA